MTTENQAYDPKKELNDIIRLYLASNPAVPEKRKTSEFEIRFRGMNGAPVSKTDYENVVQHLKFVGFKPDSSEGTNMLRVQPQYKDAKTGITKLSNIRAEIKTTKLIQEYCRTNSIQSIITANGHHLSDDKLIFTQKTPVPVTPNDFAGPKVRPVDFKDLNFRAAHQYERIHNENSESVRGMIEARAWADSKKVFRHMNRVRLSHPDYPLFVDLSIIRSSPKSGQIMIPYYTVQDANLFDRPISYEVEVEIDNMRVGTNTPFNTPDTLIASIRNIARIIMSAIQQTNYPIGNNEYKSVHHGYLRLLRGAKYEVENHSVFSRDFIGPSSKTLQIENIVSPHNGSKVPCVLEGYTVTDKADGDRKMLYVSESGKLYFIDTNMRVQYTGAKTKEKKLFSSLFDGEHIKFDKNGKYINLYAAFDVYYVAKKSMREYPFISTADSESKVGRLEVLNATVNLIQPEIDAAPIKLKPVEKLWEKLFSENKRAYYWYCSKTGEKFWDGALPPDVHARIETNLRESSDKATSMACPFRVQAKQFYIGTEATGTGGQTIFQCCDKILNTLFEYNTDGLIFTPTKYGLGGNEDQPTGPLTKITWGLSFKWKPAEYNTIDFLVRVKKDESGKDQLNVMYGETNQIQQYKTLILHVGYDEKMHGYYNPFEQLLNGEYKVAGRNEPAEGDEDTVSKYTAKPFIPSDPFDDCASLCNIYIDSNEGSDSGMYTEDGHPFEENMIVEFRFDADRKGAWRWVPIRVRYDKTAQMRPENNRPAKITANDYTTANSNWYSIHHPITQEMIRSNGTSANENNIPIDESVYYTRRSNRSESTTRALRDFHNLYVKSKIIHGVAQRNDSLIDFAVGRAGDLSKWRTSNLGFVLGVDISKDNIMHKTDGACVRYLNDVAKFPNIFDGVFFSGNSALNIRSGEAFTTHKEKKLCNAIFGEGPKVRDDLGPIVHRNYGTVKDGFHVASCQFALHYFFESMKTLQGFVRNVAECTRIGGTFIGTCWDGKRVFKMLERKTQGESYCIQGPESDSQKMMEITKMYGETGFPDDELSLGYMVNVYQESIGQTIPEYLVNFEFFVRLMENYGFILAEPEDLARMGLTSSNASFETLYNEMRAEIRQNPKLRYGSSTDMTDQEKEISFLNRYFVFKKVRNVDTKRMPMEQTVEGEDTDVDTVDQISQTFKKKRTMKEKEESKDQDKDKWIRKLGKHVVTIGKYEPVMEEVDLNMELEPERHEEEEVIQLKPAIAPKIVRTGKKLVLPKK